MLYKVTNIIANSKPYSARLGTHKSINIVASGKHLNKVLTKYKGRYYIADNSPSFKTTSFMLPMFSLYIDTMIKEIEKVRDYDKISQGFNKFDIETVFYGQIMTNHDSYSLEGLPAIIVL